MFVAVILISMTSCALRFFFFQAEDGIRDLVRSRGLGDVYKRQGQLRRNRHAIAQVAQPQPPDCGVDGDHQHVIPAAVSYTHLTLPTSDLV